jgi:hypothetical protein
MFGNSAGIGMVHILVVQRRIQEERIAVPTVCFAAVAGSSAPTTAQFRFVSTTSATLRTRSTSTVSASVGLSLDFCFLSFCKNQR